MDRFLKINISCFSHFLTLWKWNLIFFCDSLFVFSILFLRCSCVPACSCNSFIFSAIWTRYSLFMHSAVDWRSGCFQILLLQTELLRAVRLSSVVQAQEFTRVGTRDGWDVRLTENAHCHLLSMRRHCFRRAHASLGSHQQQMCSL